ncbi:M16 family metallopeptidase [Stratiformator vulcanicus]|uniref:Protease 3 n=1 Tax=Stratiformator vulcanicus TaxID=2527980 RepID=A0A517R029_9PLAN|nr:pitrilysin family protein [Stratiformator vulcanicus]QDT37256.1 Protease 3 precursor [Stratiformator vulcanicus]
MHGRPLLIAFASLIAALLPSISFAKDGSEVTQIRSIEGITEYRLENGMQVLLFPDESKPTVTVNLTMFVGSRHEGYGESGMAHLLEHMLFKGTPDHPQVPKVLQERGASFNGTTWVDRTNYYETLPASEQNLEFALRLEADRMVNSFVRAEDLASEMTVVRNEFERGENSPQRILAQRVVSAAYEWHNYGKSTIGNRADIERVPIENLQAFYKKYYRPDNAMLVIAGNFDPDFAIEKIKEYFAPLDNPDTPLPQTYTEEPAQDGERTVLLRRTGEVALAAVAYHIPAGGNPSYPAIDVLESILTAAPSGRLYKKLVEPGRAADLSGVAFAWHDPGVMRIMAEIADAQDARDVLQTMLDVLEIDLVENPVTEAEVDRAKARLLKQRELTANNSTRIAVELSEWAAMGDWRLYFLYRDRLEKVTPADVTKVAQKYLIPSNRTAGLFLPTDEPVRTQIPHVEDLAESIGEYKGREVVKAGEKFDVSPANIESRTERVELAGGAKAVLLQKQNRGETVVFRLHLNYGNEQSLQNKAMPAELLPLLMTRGADGMTRQEIQDELDRLQAQLSASGTAGGATFTLQAKKDTLPDALKLLGRVLKSATLPDEEISVAKQAQISSFQSQLNDPQSLATTKVSRNLSSWPKGDPRYMPTLEEQIEMYEDVSRDGLVGLYESQLGGADAEVAVVGTFDRDATVEAVEEMLSGWKSDVPYHRLTDHVPENIAGGYDVIPTPDKKNAVYFSATAFPMTDTDPDYPAIVLGNYILGGGSLSSRLADRVRQKEGLSYGVGSGFSARAEDPRAVFYMYAITNPENVPKLRSVIDEELAALLEKGVTEDEVERAQSGYLERQSVSRANDGNLARILGNTLEYERTMDYYTKLEESLRGLTPQQVQAALKKHLDPSKLMLVVAGDLEDNDE